MAALANFICIEKFPGQIWVPPAFVSAPQPCQMACATAWRWLAAVQRGREEPYKAKEGEMCRLGVENTLYTE